jgi:hypothetical protein
LSGDGFAQVVNFNWNSINDEVNFNSYDAGNSNANYSRPSLLGLLDSLNSERFQPTSQHATDFRYFGIEMLVGLVGHAFTIFRETQ